MNWQPIDTAPKDGTDVFLLFGNQRADVGYFRHSQTIDHGKITYEVREWCGRHMWFSTDKRPEPTHWMPIPPPPKG